MRFISIIFMCLIIISGCATKYPKVINDVKEATWDRFTYIRGQPQLKEIAGRYSGNCVALGTLYTQELIKRGILPKDIRKVNVYTNKIDLITGERGYHRMIEVNFRGESDIDGLWLMDSQIFPYRWHEVLRCGYTFDRYVK